MPVEDRKEARGQAACWGGQEDVRIEAGTLLAAIGWWYYRDMAPAPGGTARVRTNRVK